MGSRLLMGDVCVPWRMEACCYGLSRAHLLRPHYVLPCCSSGRMDLGFAHRPSRARCSLYATRWSSRVVKSMLTCSCVPCMSDPRSSFIRASSIRAGLSLPEITSCGPVMVLAPACGVGATVWLRVYGASGCSGVLLCPECLPTARILRLPLRRK